MGLSNRRRADIAAAFQRRHEHCENVVVASGQRLLQLGVAFILYSSFVGFAIPFLASPRIGLAVHTLRGLQGVFLLAVGLLWPKLRLGIAASWAAFGLLIYGATSILAAYTIAAIWGVGNEAIMLAGRAATWAFPREYAPRNAYQSAGVFVGAHRSSQLYADPLGLRITNDSGGDMFNSAQVDEERAPTPR